METKRLINAYKTCTRVDFKTGSSLNWKKKNTNDYMEGRRIRDIKMFKKKEKTCLFVLHKSQIEKKVIHTSTPRGIRERTKTSLKVSIDKNSDLKNAESSKSNNHTIRSHPKIHLVKSQTSTKKSLRVYATPRRLHKKKRKRDNKFISNEGMRSLKNEKGEVSFGPNRTTGGF